MENEKILEYMGEIEEQFIEEAAAVKGNRINDKKKTHKNNKRLMMPAACITLAVLLCTGVVVAKTWGSGIRSIFSTKEESGYDLEFQIKKLPNAVFTGKVEEVHDILVKQYQEYEPVMSWYPGAYLADFSTIEEAITYLGIDFFTNPIGEKPEAVTLNITGEESGDFTSVLLMTDYKIKGARVQIWGQIFTDVSNGADSKVGISVQDGGFFDMGERSVFDAEEKEDRIIYSGRAAEYLEYKTENGSTGSGEEALLLSTTSGENHYVSYEGYFVIKDVLYMINVAVKEGEEEEGRRVLNSLLEQY